ncbi:aspartyl-phosphate phosphatase Spo0E family protein [Bacillus sp. CMF12]|uniref:aspartyl-phosphate phosphatase Spo0E family protein n=1 Tax=Bacillaceae TaxID=186817 RepID=UPI001FB43391|nr:MULTISPECIES: aspartyl-phosphate phosphatase Spo0E family protein [Bacillaceae]UOE53230.1 aspartyl-phosphate phosphatase Spo0E family protein [Cytobacillus oceanisediminis]USK47679.1 aspartyl-phosphate phosphatase Spo0E family protein [Bacillus sp. CMF12]
MTTTSTTIKKLHHDIDVLRKKMISVGKSKGLSHPETLMYSEELDKLIYRVQRSKFII